MTGRDDELRRMKAEINLSAVAAAHGFEIDRRASSRNSLAMRHPGDGEKIIVGMDGGHWVYWAVHGGHAGSVLDFVMHRLGKNLGEARQTLRPWLTDGTTPFPTALPPSRYVERLEPVAKDVLGVRSRYEAAEPLEGPHPYLNTVRGIPDALAASWRFSGRVRAGGGEEVLFPHWNEDGLCGYELKGPGVTRFAAGGTKGLWGSRSHEGDRRLVVAETAIDALSYAALKDDGRSRYVSIAGKMNPRQPALLTRAVAKLPPGGSEVVAAVDQDAGGLDIAEDIRRCVEAAGREELRLVIDRPAGEGRDWNDVLRERTREHRSHAPPPPEPT